MTKRRAPSKRRRAAWDRKFRELCAERSRVLVFTRPQTALERKLQRHFEREIDWYEMRLMKPGFDHMRRQLRELKALGRELKRINAIIEEAKARNNG